MLFIVYQTSMSDLDHGTLKGNNEKLFIKDIIHFCYQKIVISLY